MDYFQTTFGGGSICDRVTHDLDVSGGDITNLDGLTDLKSIGQNLTINHNDLLENIHGLANLLSVDVSVGIGYNPLLTSLAGLDSLNMVGGDLSIFNNDTLTTIDALSGLSIFALVDIFRLVTIKY